MLLEMVQPHQTRDDIYINNVIIPHEKVRDEDKRMVKRVLFKELSLAEIAH
ncbi:MAG: hypothetical protein GF311_06080 [Candidatus Lokiarchaeota archaeon]|nr:hypothetical protein [Candidatus Lokiarchaeota archaeon]